MQADWQNIVTLALVALAAGYVAWRAWGILRGSGGGCGTKGGGCSTCSQNQLPTAKGGLPLVELKPVQPSSEHGKPRI